MSLPSRFKISIRSVAFCEVIGGDGSVQQFGSLKAAMDYVGMQEHAQVTISEEPAAHKMRLVLPHRSTYCFE